MYLWENGINMLRFPKLEGDMEIDVLIVGGGMAGILCAHKLQKQGVRYLLVDAETVGSGTTKGTTAALTAQHGNIYTKLVKNFDKETAKGYLKANLKAVEEYRKLADDIDFDFQDMPSYTYSTDDRHALMVESVIVKELGFDAEYVKDAGLPFETVGAVRFPRMAQFHPLKLIAALSEEMEIREHTKVLSVGRSKRADSVSGQYRYTAHTKQGDIHANKIIMSAHYPFLGMKGVYPLKLYQKRSFVVALEHAPQLVGTYADDAEGGIYLRTYEDLLLVGGGDYRTGTRNDGFETVRDFVRKHFPKVHERYAWAAQDCISLDEMPYIGNYSKSLPDVYVITGFNEWGMSSSMVAASIITDQIMGRKNSFAKIFAPDRTMFRKQLAVNMAETMKSYLTPTTRRCTHMGCALKKNIEENTWDCPCHGSRFDEKGCVLDNPAKRDIKF